MSRQGREATGLLDATTYKVMRAKQATGSGKMIWMLQKRQAPVTAAPIRIMSRKPYHGLEAGHELPVWRNQWSAAHLFPELPAKPLAADELTLDTDARHANTCVYTYSSLEHNPPRTLTTFLRSCPSLSHTAAKATAAVGRSGRVDSDFRTQDS